MKNLTIALVVMSVIGLSSCSQGWYDHGKHKDFKKPITHKVKSHQKAPKH